MKASVFALAAVALAQDPQQPDDQQPDAQQPDITAIATLLTENDLNVLAETLGKFPDLVAPLLNDTDGYTVFAPADEPLGAAAPGLDEETLRAVLTYHVSLNPVDPSDEALPPGKSAVVATALTSEGLGGEAQVVIVSKDDDGNVSVRHGKGDAAVTNPIAADPNFIHVLDDVLIPPGNLTDVLTGAGLDALVAAVTQANLGDTLNSAQSITLFAPTNEAFQAFSAANPEVSDEDLIAALQYHVVPSVVYSPNVEAGNVGTLLEGKAVAIDVGDAGVTVNGANVTDTDILSANGVVHVIDAVLSPADAQVPDEKPDEEGGDGDAAPSSGMTTKASVLALAILPFLF